MAKYAKALTAFVEQNGGSGMKVPDDIMQDYLDSMKSALEEIFVDHPRFPRTSNLGQDPLLLWCKKNYPDVKEDFSAKMRVTFFQGKVLEALVVALLRMAGIARPEEFQVRGSFRMEGIPDDITGTCDWQPNLDSIIDIKTAHNDAYLTKWASQDTLAEHDDYNYIPQGYGYSKMFNKPFKGWLVINKNNGEWKDVEVTDDYMIHNDSMVAKLESDMRAAYGKERPPLPDGEPELYKGEPTGNIRVPAKWARTPYVKLLWPDAVAAKRGEQKIYYLQPFNGVKIPGIKLV